MLMTDWIILAWSVLFEGSCVFGLLLLGVLGSLGAVGLGRLDDCFRLHGHHPYRRAIYKVARWWEMARLVEDQVDPGKLLLAQQRYHPMNVLVLLPSSVSNTRDGCCNRRKLRKRFFGGNDELLTNRVVIVCAGLLKAVVTIHK